MNLLRSWELFIFVKIRRLRGDSSFIIWITFYAKEIPYLLNNYHRNFFKQWLKVSVGYFSFNYVVSFCVYSGSPFCDPLVVSFDSSRYNLKEIYISFKFGARASKFWETFYCKRPQNIFWTLKNLELLLFWREFVINVSIYIWLTCVTSWKNWLVNEKHIWFELTEETNSRQPYQ